MKVIEKPQQYDSLQWIGNNKVACDRFAGEKSERDGDTLIYQGAADDHKCELNGWIVKSPDSDSFQLFTDADFQVRFAAVA